jgi:hypothetical protein
VGAPQRLGLDLARVPVPALVLFEQGQLARL